MPVRRSLPYLTDVVAADGQPLVRPYVVEWERERDQHEWRCFPWEAAV
ncbi:hypothetical protein AB0N07_18435 [Streptomyces sp. NPDC051172]